MKTPKVHAVVITFCRPAILAETLEAFRAQTRPPDSWLIVDNDADDAVAALAARIESARYLAMPDNLGPAGAIAAGMTAALEHAAPEDWILLIDDDDPPLSASALEEMAGFAARMPDDVALVGLTGARYRRSSGVLQRVTDDDLTDLTDVDYVGNNQLPHYRAAAIRNVGEFDPALFFGMEELEYGLRLRQRGWRIVINREMTLRARERSGRVGLGRFASFERTNPLWRSYYAARNEVLVAARYGRWPAPLAVSARALLGGAGAAVRERRTDVLAARSRGLYDGWRGNVGRTVEPRASSVPCLLGRR